MATQRIIVERLTPPVPKGTAHDLLALSKSGVFGRGGDWSKVRRVAGRRSRDLRPVS